MSSGNVHLMQTCSRNIIPRPLATLINLSGQKGHFPSKLKYAKIIPVYKDGDESEPCNYRPIPLVPIFNRIFKKILYNRLKYFFAPFSLLEQVYRSLIYPYLSFVLVALGLAARSHVEKKFVLQGGVRAPKE